MDRLWDREFSNVTSEAILSEVQRNLSGKLALNPDKLSKFLADLRAASTVVKPTGTLTTTPHGPDNLVLETAVLGIAIEAPAAFLKRLK